MMNGWVLLFFDAVAVVLYGWLRRKPCKTCKGSGRFAGVHCWACDGKGKRW